MYRREQCINYSLEVGLIGYGCTGGSNVLYSLEVGLIGYGCTGGSNALIIAYCKVYKDTCTWCWYMYMYLYMKEGDEGES